MYEAGLELLCFFAGCAIGYRLRRCPVLNQEKIEAIERKGYQARLIEETIKRSPLNADEAYSPPNYSQEAHNEVMRKITSKGQSPNHTQSNSISWINTISAALIVVIVVMTLTLFSF